MPFGPMSLAVVSILDTTCAGVHVGFLYFTSRATPETMAAEKDVPIHWA